MVSFLRFEAMNEQAEIQSKLTDTNPKFLNESPLLRNNENPTAAKPSKLRAAKIYDFLDSLHNCQAIRLPPRNKRDKFKIIGHVCNMLNTNMILKIHIV